MMKWLAVMNIDPIRNELMIFMTLWQIDWTVIVSGVFHWLMIVGWLENEWLFHLWVGFSADLSWEHFMPLFVSLFSCTNLAFPLQIFPSSTFYPQFFAPALRFQSFFSPPLKDKMADLLSRCPYILLIAQIIWFVIVYYLIICFCWLAW